MAVEERGWGRLTQGLLQHFVLRAPPPARRNATAPSLPPSPSFQVDRAGRGGRGACPCRTLLLSPPSPPCSRGEDLEELPSADLRFMLVPALLAAVLLKQSGGDAEHRLEILERARGLFLRFLAVGRDYGLGRFQMPRAKPPSCLAEEQPPECEESSSEECSLSIARPRSEQAALLAMAANRQAKIERCACGGLRRARWGEEALREAQAPCGTPAALLGLLCQGGARGFRAASCAELARKDGS